MIIDISKVIADKMEQMQKDRVIENKIEETVEKVICDTISSELSSWEFRKAISDEVEKSIGNVASELGLGAYNGFIAETVKKVVKGMYEADMAEKVAETLSNTILKKYDEVKLSYIFDQYRKWVCETTDESEKYERERFHCELETKEDGYFTWYNISFSEKELDYSDHPDIKFRLCQCSGEDKSRISYLWLDSEEVDGKIRIGTLTEFEAFILNLYYNETPIILDVDDVDDSCTFDIDI